MNAEELIKFISDKYDGDLVNSQLYSDIVNDCEKIINRRAEIISYDLVKCFCAKSALIGNTLINKDILKMSLYNLKDDELIRKYTDYDIYKSIDDVYKSNDVDNSFVNLMTFGVVGKLEFSNDNRYIIFWNEKECTNILNEEKYNPLLKDILD